MQMRKKITMSCLLLALITSSAPLHADQCDDLHGQAKEALSTVKEAQEQKDYQGIIDIYNQSAGYYEQIDAIGNCRCPKILKAAPEKAQYYRDKATKLASELAIKQQYDEAAEQFNQGNEYAKNRDWGMAIINFESAIATWDSIVAQYPDSENGKIAAKSAKMARNAVEQARKYQKLNI